MAKTSATEDALGLIHKAVADGLKEDYDDLCQIEDAATRIQLKAKLRDQMITFLKNNGITAAQENNALSDLRDQLAQRKEQRRQLGGAELDGLAAEWVERGLSDATGGRLQ